MPYLVSNDTADWIRRQKTAPGDMRFRPRLARPSAADAQPGPPQWRVAAIPLAVGFEIRVSPGLLAWGGGHNVTWPADGASVPLRDSWTSIGEIEDGTKWIVWSTRSPPCPTTHDTRWPLGDGPKAHATGTVGGESVSLESDITDLEGDPDAFSADAGAVTLEDPDFARPPGVTDWRLVAVVTVARDRARVTQLLSDTITVNAIVRPGEEEDTEPSDDEERQSDDIPPCGNPLNGPGRPNPLDGGGSAHPEDGHDQDDNPLDHEGDGGYTPKCDEG